MNIDDVEKVDERKQHTILEIFALQKKLMVTYEPIERKLGAIVPDQPWVIDRPKVQMRLKDMFWRFVEELTEACEHLDKMIGELAPFGSNWKSAWDTSSEVRHFFEEIVDSVHFLTEATIISNIDPQVIVSDFDLCFVGKRADDSYMTFNAEGITQCCWQMVQRMGLAANCLKNKPWKQTQVLTDRAKYEQYLLSVWVKFFYFWSMVGGHGDDLYNLYFRKQEVNRFRQRSNY